MSSPSSHFRSVSCRYTEIRQHLRVYVLKVPAYLLCKAFHWVPDSWPPDVPDSRLEDRKTAMEIRHCREYPYFFGSPPFCISCHRGRLCIPGQASVLDRTRKDTPAELFRLIVDETHIRFLEFRMSPIPVHLAVEDDLSEAVIRRLLLDTGREYVSDGGLIVLMFRVRR
jgi:hypothetical protein